MSRLTLKIFTLILTLLTFTTLFADSPNYDENLPETWYTLPEDMGSRAAVQPYTELNEKQKTGIDRVLDAHHNGFDEFDRSVPTPPRGEWKLEALITDLSVSLSGIVGALIAKGEATVALYWRRVQQRSTEVETATLDDKSVDAEFSTDDSYDSLEKKLEPLIKAILATRQVNNEHALRKNLIGKVFESHEVIQYLAATPQASWKVSKLRVDLAIDVSGKVNPVTTVGGGIKIRLDWMLKSRAAHLVAKTREQRKIGDGLKKIAMDLVGVLQDTKFEDMTATHFTLKEIKLGLGIFGEGNVGVVKVGGSLFGYLYLVPNRSYDRSIAPVMASRSISIPVIDYSNNAQWQGWADSQHISYQVFQNRDGSSAVVYSALTDRFRQGLEKANQMGNRFVERAAQHKRRWEVYQLKTEFALSLSGDLGLFKLGGTGALELVFAK